ncbi:hypothetical protein [Pseudoruegeria sp. HB172150]|uniref:hypothetical protein n=1 Tax=Pseudoruegeria sp. HB172150 TaxID=2721164 RepID=UPI0015547E8E|nr:hypothetical protein [Pseudoruegeria sp. HB172150]
MAHVIAASLAIAPASSALAYSCTGLNYNGNTEYTDDNLQTQFDQIDASHTSSPSFWVLNDNYVAFGGKSIKDVQILQFCENNSGESFIVREVLSHNISYSNAARIKLRWNDTCRLQVEVRWKTSGDYHRIHDAYDPGENNGVAVFIKNNGDFGYKGVDDCR